MRDATLILGGHHFIVSYHRFVDRDAGTAQDEYVLQTPHENVHVFSDCDTMLDYVNEYVAMHNTLADVRALPVTA